MKKQFKTKLVLNSQTIRRLRDTGLQHVQGGFIDRNTDDECPTAICTAGCRACG